MAAQPLEDLAYQVLGDPNILEILTAPDPSLAARSAFGSTSQLAVPLIFKAVIALRQQKASYVFGSSSGSNVCLQSPGVNSEEDEMTLYYTKLRVHVQFFTNSTYINNRPAKVRTLDLLEATQIQIQTFMFHLIPVCSLVPGPHTDVSVVSGTSSAGQQQPFLNDFRCGRSIGRGGRGSVYIYRCKKSQETLAVKILEPVDAQEVKRATRETLIS